MSDRCKETVDKQGYHLVSAGRAWRNRGKCDRKAGPSGYCWQHAPARAVWDAELKRNAKRRKQRDGDKSE